MQRVCRAQAKVHIGRYLQDITAVATPSEQLLIAEAKITAAATRKELLKHKYCSC